MFTISPQVDAVGTPGPPANRRHPPPDRSVSSATDSPRSGLDGRAERGRCRLLQINCGNYAELAARVGTRVLTIQMSIPTGRTAESVKPNVVALGERGRAEVQTPIRAHAAATAIGPDWRGWRGMGKISRHLSYGQPWRAGCRNGTSHCLDRRAMQERARTDAAAGLRRTPLLAGQDIFWRESVHRVTGPHRPGLRGVCSPNRPAPGRLVQPAQFIGLAAVMMRRILLNHARDWAADKRGAGENMSRFATVAGDDIGAPEIRFPPVPLHEALDRLAALDERKSRIVELSFLAA